MLTNRIGIISLLMGAAFLLQSCRESTLYPNRNPDPDTNPTALAVADVYGVEWELEAFESWSDGKQTNETDVPAGQRYTLTFNQDGLGGINDCNSYGAEYTLGADNGITIFSVLSTLAECGPTSRDGQFGMGLTNAVRYEMNATTLRLFGPSVKADLNSSMTGMEALRFKRVRGPEIRLMQMELVDPAPSDPYSILSAQITGDQLRLKVQYGGGCAEHTFSLMGPLTIPAGDPTPITAYLHHDANGDACEALITQDLIFDLTPLRDRWKNVTGKTFGTIALTIFDLHSGQVGPMTYNIGNGGSTIPNWLQDTINAIRSRAVTSPGESIWQYTYNGDVVYYRPPICCDIFSVLYDANGNVLCHPDGGIAGLGDGRCNGFVANRTDEKLIWQDPR